MRSGRSLARRTHRRREPAGTLASCFYPSSLLSMFRAEPVRADLLLSTADVHGLDCLGPMVELFLEKDREFRRRHPHCARVLTDGSEALPQEVILEHDGESTVQLVDDRAGR